MGHGPNFETGMFEGKIKDGGKVEKLVAAIDLRAFYMDLHDTLVAKKFTDIIDNPDGGFLNNQTKAGEFTDNKAYMNRTGDMFEKKFYVFKKDGVPTEIEILWKAKKKSEITDYGWYEIKIDLVCRFITNKEILDGNKKIVLQSGGWEFRNEVIYKNNMIKKYLNTIPFVKNSKFLKEMYYEHMYVDKIEYDIDFGEHKIMKIIYTVIDKHFGTHLAH